MTYVPGITFVHTSYSLFWYITQSHPAVKILIELYVQLKEHKLKAAFSNLLILG